MSTSESRGVSHRIGRARRGGRGTVGGSAGFAISLVVLLVGSPLAAAGPTVLGPPFSGATAHAYFESATGCYSFVTSHRSTFSMKTGAFRTGLSAKASACPGGPTSTNYASLFYRDPGIDFWVPFKVAQASSTMSVAWTASWAQSLHFSINGSLPCPTHPWSNSTYTGIFGVCETGVFTEVDAGFLVYDQTTAAYIVQNYALPETASLYNSTMIAYLCHSSSCVSSNSTNGPTGATFAQASSASGTSYLNATYATADQYYLEVAFVVYLEAYTQGYSQGTASASLDLSNSTRSLTLTSIVVS